MPLCISDSQLNFLFFYYNINFNKSYFYSLNYNRRYFHKFMVVTRITEEVYRILEYKIAFGRMLLLIKRWVGITNNFDFENCW